MPWRSMGQALRRAAAGVPSARKRSHRTRRPDREGLACVSLRNLQEISRAFPRTSADGALIIRAHEERAVRRTDPERGDAHERKVKMTIQANSSNNSVVRRRNCRARRLAICGAFVLLSLGIGAAAAAPE